MVYDFTWSLVGISQEHVGNVESPIPCISQGSPGKPASQVVQWVKKLPAMQVTQEMQIWTLVWADPLEEGLATHSSILAWRIPWTEEPGGLLSIGWQRVKHNWSDWASMHAPEKHNQYIRIQDISVYRQDIFLYIFTYAYISMSH